MDPKIAASLAPCGISMNDEPLDVTPTLIAYLGGDIKNIGIADIEALDAALGKISQYVKRVPDEGWNERMAKIVWPQRKTAHDTASTPWK